MGNTIRLQRPGMSESRQQMLITVSTNWSGNYSTEAEDKWREKAEKEAGPDEDFFFFKRE